MFNRIYKIFLIEKIILAFKKDYVGYGDANKSDVCLREGYLPILVDYFSPIPDIEDLEKRKVWNKKTRLTGIDFNLKNQLNLLKRIGQKYSHELKGSNWEKRLFADRGATPLYHLIREFQPKQITVIGIEDHSGVINLALKENERIDGKPTKYQTFRPESTKSINKTVFDNLSKNDFLYFNLDHYIKIGSDVNYLYLDILPRLKPGVIVGIENIALPYEYPKDFITEESNRRFWTEQYLLQAFLINNDEFEVILAMNFLFNDHTKELKNAFSTSHNKNINFNRSFWIRRKIK